MPHRILFLDFETYYDAEYSLREMAPPNYILDPRYETILCAAKVDDGRPFVVDGPAFPEFIREFNPADTTTVTFNALFDNCILAWHYSFVPSRMYCAMRMAAALRGHLLNSVSLASVCRFLGLPPKGTFIENMKGKHRADLIGNINDWNGACTYAMDDVLRCAEIFNILIPEFPHGERRVMDRVLRCAVEPTFHIDTDMLRDHLKDLADDKVKMLRLASGATEASLCDDNMTMDLNEPSFQDGLDKFARELRSNPRFEALLQEHGVDIEYKTSPSDPDRRIPAFAKTDEFMAGLLDHEDPQVQALATARLGLRSTIEESRGKRILSIAELPWACYRDGNPRPGGTMPIPLRYSGAHTHRLSGDWSINMQNLPSGRGTKVSKLRKAIVAPPGHEVVAGDLAQIEARITAWLCGQADLLEQFALDLDPYARLGARIFDLPIGQEDGALKKWKAEHPLERFIGKSGVLGLGFGCGAEKFYNMVVRAARGMGMDMPKLLQVWTPGLADKSVSTYRTLNYAIVRAWRTLDQHLQMAWCGLGAPVKFGPVVIGAGYVEGPGNLKMLYDVSSRDPNDLRYRYGKSEHKMYGSKFLENIVQFLARIVIMNAALRLWDRGYKFRLQSHDELVFIVPTADVATAKAVIHEELSRRPSWAPSLPLAAEVNSGHSYGDAK